MIPPHRAHFHREIQHVQQFIQTRLQTDEPSVLSVNAAQMDEYYDEVQNYVKQKQRQSQVRRPLPTSQGPPTSAKSFSHPSPVASAPPTSAKSFSHPSPVAALPSPYTSAKSFSYGSDRSSPRAGFETKPSSAYVEPRAPPSPSTMPFKLPGMKWLLGSARNKHEPQPSVFEPCIPSPHAQDLDPMLPFTAHPANSQRILKKQKTM